MSTEDGTAMVADTVDEAPPDQPVRLACLICNCTLQSTIRGCFNIFQATTQTSASRQPFHDRLGTILGVPLLVDEVRSPLVCKKCFKHVNDVDTVEVSLEAMKDDIRTKYTDSTNAAQEPAVALPKEEVPAVLPKRRGRPPRRFRDEDDEDYNVKDTPYNPGRKYEPKPKPAPVPPPPPAVQASEPATIVPDVPEDADQNSIAVEVDPSLVKMEGEDAEFEEMIGLDDAAYEELFSSDTGRFKCKECEKAFVFAKTASDHMFRAHSIRCYLCDVCEMEFDKKPDMMAHFDSHASEAGEPYKCDHCQKGFQDPKKYRDHLKFHLMKIHACSVCNKTFTSKRLLEEHLNAHKGVRPYKCDQCEKSFAYHNSLKNHAKLHSNRPRPYQCKECGKEFLNAYHLQSHRRVHTGQKEHTCETCGKNFSTAYNLESHKVVHTGERPYPCKHCGKTFGRRELLRDHIRIHTGERPYQCEICGATFSKRANFIFHKEASHYNIRRHKCNLCNKAFTRRRLLDYHNHSVHTGEKPYKCTQCPAAFVYPHHFKKHLKIHTGEKPYKCEICDKAFNSKENRNAHRFVHSDKKPYECRVCGQGFMRKPALYAHMQTADHMGDIIIVNQLQLPETAQSEESDIHIQLQDTVAEDDPNVQQLAVQQNEMGELMIVNQLQFEGQDPEGIRYIISDDGTFSQESLEGLTEDGVKVVLVQAEV